ncbi:MAG: hypothetical protein Q7U97_04890 [Rhodocyclaceae bacterium]|jgi:hypothetical protein|nr:hypothetical protein [Rhodocyclaceae bacterium]
MNRDQYLQKRHWLHGEPIDTATAAPQGWQVGDPLPQVRHEPAGVRQGVGVAAHPGVLTEFQRAEARRAQTR